MSLQYPLGSVVRVASSASASSSPSGSSVAPAVSFRADAKAALQQAATLTAMYLGYVLDSQIGPRKLPYTPEDVLTAARRCKIPGLADALEEFVDVSRLGHVEPEAVFAEIDEFQARNKEGVFVDLEAMVGSIDWLEKAARDDTLSGAFSRRGNSRDVVGRKGGLSLPGGSSDARKHMVAGDLAAYLPATDMATAAQDGIAVPRDPEWQKEQEEPEEDENSPLPGFLDGEENYTAAEALEGHPEEADERELAGEMDDAFGPPDGYDAS